MEKRIVIVTGGAGYIGSHTVVALHESGYRPVIIDDFSNSKPEVLDGIAKITGVKPQLFSLDCRSKNDLLEALQSCTADGEVAGVIHFAAYKAVGESTEKPLDYFENNIGSTVSLLAAMSESGVSNLVFSSSCTVYGQPDQIPVDESAPILPAESPYGYTKQACERLIMDAFKSSMPLSACLLRYFNPIGAHQSANIGELPIGHPNNLIPYLTQAVAGLRNPLTVFGNDYPTEDGTCIRDYIHVMDLARAHVASIAWLESNSPSCEAFNLGTGTGKSVSEVIAAFEKTNGIEVPYAFGPRRSGDVVAIFANAEKAHRELGWNCEFNLEEALRDAWKWQLQLAQA
ncbi:MAG: UDP-glucose 4-epimerase GalE [Crocinitomicaceae bacterium]|nr:UDP-glucose 4-epimerase GalE [Crocinitomicaceae bacterium]|tara:strand:- start:1917 stop:2948 length:1032 start_codon:yes stop_codon:yes gene_type:complete